MEAKYHIVTDLQCRILHFGKDLCIAIPGEDACINLSRGRHLLSFVSTENPADSYMVTFEVPESDIEDFIEVRINPIRQKRLQRERKEEEQRRRKEEQEAQAELERLNRVRLAEEKKKRDEEKRNQEHLFYIKEFSKLNDYLFNLFSNRGAYSVITSKCHDGKYGFLKSSDDTNAEGMQTWIITPQYDIATPFFYGVSLVGKIIKKRPGYYDWKYSYINTKNNVIYEFDNCERGMAFFLGVGIIIDILHNTLKFIDNKGNLLYKKPVKDVLSVISGRPEFPFSVFYSSYINPIRFFFKFKDKDYEQRLSLKNNFALEFIESGRHFITSYAKAYETMHDTPDNYYLLRSYSSFEELYYWMG